MLQVIDAWFARGFGPRDHLLRDTECDRLIGRHFASRKSLETAAKYVANNATEYAPVRVEIKQPHRDLTDILTIG